MAKSLAIVVGLLSAILAPTVPSAWALTVPEEVELRADDAQVGDFFGDGVAVSGNTALVGAWGVDDVDGNAGAAYVFQREGGVWEQEAKLLPEGGLPGGAFGRLVALDGDTALIAEPTSSFPGAAYVFTRADGVWTLEAKLVPDDSQNGDRFGIGLALDGDTALIGAPLHDGNGEDAGSGYVFVRTGGLWEQQAKLLPADGAAGDSFGWGADLEGDTAMLGARRNDELGEDAGAAYVFTRAAGVWTQQAKLLSSDGVEGDDFGAGIALDGENALIGADWADATAEASGAAYVFTFDGDGWTEQAKLVASDGVDHAFFGRDVALLGNTAVIGAQGDDQSGNQSGAAYVFTFAGGSWTEQAKLSASDGEGGDFLGSAVALSENTVIVGAFSHDHGIFASGSAYVYPSLGDDDVPAASPVGAMLLLLAILGTGAYFMRLRRGC